MDRELQLARGQHLDALEAELRTVHRVLGVEAVLGDELSTELIQPSLRSPGRDGRA